MSLTSEQPQVGAETEGHVLATADDASDAPMHRSVTAVSLETDTSELIGAFSDKDSAISSWRSTRTQSLTSSVVDYQYENGRRYHAFREGEYHLPNDENEQDRLEMQHAIYRYALDDRLYLAPIPKGELHDVLDVGCGTGLWEMDVADEHPEAQVLGFDLSPIQPDMVPLNARFLVDDCNAEWVFVERFDLIHTRVLTPGIKDWSRYLRQAYEHLKPGGYIELHEIHVPAGCTEASADPKPYFVEWSELLRDGGLKTDLDFSAPKRLQGLLHETGYTNITVQWQHWPVGPWAKGAKNKHIGRLWAEDMKHVSRNTAAILTRVLLWSAEEFEVFAAKIANEIDDGKKHMWVEMFFAYAQKPAQS